MEGQQTFVKRILHLSSKHLALTLSGKYQIRLARDCRKTHPTRKYLKNQKQNMKKHYQKVDVQQSYHIPTIYLTIITPATGTATPRLFVIITEIKTESAI